MFLSILAVGSVWAQTQEEKTEVTVAPGDVLIIHVPQRPDLDRELVVRSNGSVSIPVIGQVDVAGLEPAEVEARLLQTFKRYYPSLTSVEVDVRQRSRDMIYVLGEVASPGRYRFDVSPNIWEAIREADGPTGEAELDRVRIIRDISRGGTTSVVDLARALESGSVEQLPKLEIGDTVIIPPSRERDIAGGAVVSVFGAVLEPGVYKLTNDLMSAILVAGGPTELAALRNIKIVRPQRDGTNMTIGVDFERFLELGDPRSNPALRPGDAVSVPEVKGVKRVTRSRLALDILTAAVAVTTIIIAFSNNN